MGGRGGKGVGCCEGDKANEEVGEKGHRKEVREGDRAVSGKVEEEEKGRIKRTGGAKELHEGRTREKRRGDVSY